MLQLRSSLNCHLYIESEWRVMPPEQSVLEVHVLMLLLPLEVKYGDARRIVSSGNTSSHSLSRRDLSALNEAL